MTVHQPTPSWIYIAVMIACVCFLAVGFFFAARQHFMAIDLGIKNSKLRKQVEDMEGQQRRLVLSREVVRSPLEMKRIAARHGLRPADNLFDPVQVGVKPAPQAPLVQKTGMSSPVMKAEKPVKAFFAPGTKIDPKPAKVVSRTIIASAKAN